ncbi:glycosyl hydrolase [Paenibacillus castaneae]|nr:glycosyl hydrolase [Paenibacillus castaneae]
MLLPFENVSYADQSSTVGDKLINFEDGTTNGWAKGWGEFAANNPIEVSQDLKRENNSYALKVNANYTGKDWQTASITLDHGLNLSDYKKLVYDVYVPVAFEGTLDVGTSLREAWTDLDNSHHNIIDLKSDPVILNGQEYVKIHKNIILPYGLTQSQLVIQLQKNSALTYAGPIYLDDILLQAREPEQPGGPSVKIEAESGELGGGAAIKSGVPSDTNDVIEGYSGTGYVFFGGDGFLTLKYTVPAVGLYDLKIGYHSPFGPKDTVLVLNGKESGQITLPKTVSFNEISGGKVLLQAGENTIRFNNGWGWYNIDYITLAPAAAPAPHQVEKKLVNPNATPEAQALINYLVDNYGKKILSGQQELSMAKWIKEQTGKYPAILSHDLIEYSPSRVENGSSSMAVEEMMEWAKDGGLISLCWHWNAPLGIGGNEPGHEWWRGFYTEHTTFDVKAALNDKESEGYRLILRDIDAIAVQLKRLQDAEIPVLWRPLHEAEGGWFWWGAKGPGPAKQLYRLMYDRLTNYHHLNNLIWVWNSPSADWYPGDDVVDIISQDIYNNAGDYSPNINKYQQSVSVVNDRKLVALPENGPIPDPDLLQAYRADWSWFSTWTGNYITDGKNNTAAHLNKVYNSDYVITRDELPSNMKTYGLPTSGTSTGSPSVSPPVQKIITVDDLKKDKDGNISIMLADGQTDSVMSQDVLKLVGSSDITLNVNGLTIHIPNASIQAALSIGQGKEGKLVFKAQALSEKEAGELQGSLVYPSNESFAIRGKIYDIQLIWESQEGKQSISQLAQPFTVSFPVPAQGDASKLGVYYLNDKGRPEYMGGTKSGNEVKADLPHLSKYALAEYSISFSDVPSTHWAYEAIQQMTSKHELQGITSTLFKPSAEASRSEVTVALAKRLGLKPSSSKPFDDVDSKSEASSYIAAAFEAGLVKGTGGKSFHPDSAITRQELAVILKRAYELLMTMPATAERKAAYADRDQIAGWAVDAVDLTSELGIFRGKAANKLDPRGSVTRAELAQIMERITAFIKN